MTNRGAPLVIFADVDGVLATRAAETFAADLAMLDGLAPRVAVVLCSGRTRPEIEHLWQVPGMHHPFICEFGAAAFVPDGYFPIGIPSSTTVAGYQVVEFGRSSASIVDVLKRTAERQGVPIRCFSEMSVEEVARERRLSLLGARLAKLRDYGEWFRVEDPRSEARLRFLDALRASHLRCISGAGFDHVGAAVDFSIGVGLLRTLYRRAYGTVVTVGVADWRSDGDLLQLVEYPVALESRERDAGHGHSRRLSQARVVTLGGEFAWVSAVADVVRTTYGAPSIADA
jgi:mannosyl-3-phosphoglycerate phosphatase